MGLATGEWTRNTSFKGEGKVMCWQAWMQDVASGHLVHLGQAKL